MSDVEETKEQRREKLLQNLAKGRATRLENIRIKKQNTITEDVSCKYCNKAYKSVHYKEKHELTCKKKPNEDEKEDEKVIEEDEKVIEKSESEDEKPKAKPKKIKKKKKIIYETETESESSSSEEEVIVRKKRKSKPKKRVTHNETPENIPPPPKLERQKRMLSIKEYEELRTRRIKQNQMKKMEEERNNQQNIMNQRIQNMLNGNF
tara:strand:+ start:1042 stop:1662 length:621 start_codon:yes stop_codon:yes gene_type:complete